MSKDIVDSLRESRGAAAVGLSNILDFYSKDKSAVFTAFEGEDYCYYSIRIKENLGVYDFIPIRCSGKKDVLKLRERLAARNDLSDLKIAFFVDKDFDDNSDLAGSADVYITPYYSIESFYATDVCLKGLLHGMGGFDGLVDADLINKVIEIYSQTSREFYNSIKLLNVWIWYAVRFRGDLRLLLNESKRSLDKFVDISLGSVQSKYDNSFIDVFFDCDSGDFFDEMDNFDHCINSISDIRGKYALDFFMTFFKCLKAEFSASNSTVFTIKKNIKLNPSERTILSDFSSYAYTPPCLKLFLKELSIRWGFTVAAVA